MTISLDIDGRVKTLGFFNVGQALFTWVDGYINLAGMRVIRFISGALILRIIFPIWTPLPWRRAGARDF